MVEILGKRIALALLSILIICAQTLTPGNQGLSPLWPIIPAYTTSTLPTYGIRNRVAFVTNAASSSSCTVGGGSAVVLCRDTGSAWAVVTGGGGGGGGVGSYYGTFTGTTSGTITAATHQQGEHPVVQVYNSSAELVSAVVSCLTAGASPIGCGDATSNGNVVIGPLISGTYTYVITGSGPGPEGPTGPTGPTGPAGGVLSITKTVSSAELLAMPTPVEVVPAPGAGKYIAVVGVSLVYIPGNVDYIDGTDNSAYHGAFYGTSDPVSYDSAGVVGIAENTYWSRYESPDGFVVIYNMAFYMGDDGDTTIAMAENQPISYGPVSVNGKGCVVGTTLNSGGSGYLVGDTGTIDSATNSATYEVDTINGMGAVLTYTITAPGKAYTVGTNMATTATTGIGSGFTVDITDVRSLCSGNGTAKVTISYTIVDL